METTITAIYERGMLRPLTLLPLAEHTTVRLQIVEQVAPEVKYPLLALADLGEAGEDNVSERAKEILAAEIDTVAGWSVPNANLS
jgi:predicted DNA-binding antitoxin AbrB/MazE fold protein